MKHKSEHYITVQTVVVILMKLCAESSLFYCTRSFSSSFQEQVQYIFGDGMKIVADFYSPFLRSFRPPISGQLMAGAVEM